MVLRITYHENAGRRGQIHSLTVSNLVDAKEKVKAFIKMDALNEGEFEAEAIGTYNSYKIGYDLNSTKVE